MTPSPSSEAEGREKKLPEIEVGDVMVMVSCRRKLTKAQEKALGQIVDAGRAHLRKLLDAAAERK